LRWKIPRAIFYPERDEIRTESNQIAPLAPARCHDCHTRKSRLSLTHKVDAAKTLCGRGGRCRTLAGVFRFAVFAACAPCRAALTAAPALQSSALLSAALLSAALLSSALPSSSAVLAHDGARR
jgi:hypothetical protein